MATIFDLNPEEEVLRQQAENESLAPQPDTVAPTVRPPMNQLEKGFRRRNLGLRRAFGETGRAVGEITGIEPLATYGQEVAERARAEERARPDLAARVPMFDEVQDLDSLADWVQAKVGETISDITLGVGGAVVGGAAGGPAGAITGASAALYPTHFGDNLAEARETAAAQGVELQNLYRNAGLSAAVQTALDVVGPAAFISSVIPREAGKRLLRRVGEGAAIGTVSEGLTEAGQEYVGVRGSLEPSVPGYKMPDQEFYARLREAALAGGALGGMFGGLGGAVAPAVARDPSHSGLIASGAVGAETGLAEGMTASGFDDQIEKLSPSFITDPESPARWLLQQVAHQERSGLTDQEKAFIRKEIEASELRSISPRLWDPATRRWRETGLTPKKQRLLDLLDRVPTLQTSDEQANRRVNRAALQRLRMDLETRQGVATQAERLQDQAELLADTQEELLDRLTDALEYGDTVEFESIRERLAALEQEAQRDDARLPETLTREDLVKYRGEVALPGYVWDPDREAYIRSIVTDEMEDLQRSQALRSTTRGGREELGGGFETGREEDLIYAGTGMYGMQRSFPFEKPDTSPRRGEGSEASQARGVTQRDRSEEVSPLETEIEVAPGEFEITGGRETPTDPGGVLRDYLSEAQVIRRDRRYQEDLDKEVIMAPAKMVRKKGKKQPVKQRRYRGLERSLLMRTTKDGVESFYELDLHAMIDRIKNLVPETQEREFTGGMPTARIRELLYAGLADRLTDEQFDTAELVSGLEPNVVAFIRSGGQPVMIGDLAEGTVPEKRVRKRQQAKALKSDKDTREAVAEAVRKPKSKAARVKAPLTDEERIAFGQRTAKLAGVDLPKKKKPAKGSVAEALKEKPKEPAPVSDKEVDETIARILGLPLDPKKQSRAFTTKELNFIVGDVTTAQSLKDRSELPVGYTGINVLTIKQAKKLPTELKANLVNVLAESVTPGPSGVSPIDAFISRFENRIEFVRKNGEMNILPDEYSLILKMLDLPTGQETLRFRRGTQAIRAAYLSGELTREELDVRLNKALDFYSNDLMEPLVRYHWMMTEEDFTRERDKELIKEQWDSYQGDIDDQIVMPNGRWALTPEAAKRIIKLDAERRVYVSALQYLDEFSAGMITGSQLQELNSKLEYDGRNVREVFDKWWAERKEGRNPGVNDWDNWLMSNLFRIRSAKHRLIHEGSKKRSTDVAPVDSTVKVPLSELNNPRWREDAKHPEDTDFYPIVKDFNEKAPYDNEANFVDYHNRLREIVPDLTKLSEQYNQAKNDSSRKVILDQAIEKFVDAHRLRNMDKARQAARNWTGKDSLTLKALQKYHKDVNPIDALMSQMGYMRTKDPVRLAFDRQIDLIYEEVPSFAEIAKRDDFAEYILLEIGKLPVYKAFVDAEIRRRNALNAMEAADRSQVHGDGWATAAQKRKHLKSVLDRLKEEAGKGHYAKLARAWPAYEYNGRTNWDPRSVDKEYAEFWKADLDLNNALSKLYSEADKLIHHRYNELRSDDRAVWKANFERAREEALPKVDPKAREELSKRQAESDAILQDFRRRQREINIEQSGLELNQASRPPVGRLSPNPFRFVDLREWRNATMTEQRLEGVKAKLSSDPSIKRAIVRDNEVTYVRDDAVVNEDLSPSFIADITAGLRIGREIADRARRYDDLDAKLQKKTQAVVDRWGRKLGLKAKIKVVSAADTVPKLFGNKALLNAFHLGALHGVTWADVKTGQVSIWINPAITGTLRREILAHEYGHAIYKAAFINISQPEARGVLDQYKRWREKHGKKTAYVDALIRSKKTPAAAANYISELVGSSRVGEMHAAEAEYLLDFEEWFADEVSKVLTDSSTLTGPVRRFFNRIVQAIKKLFGIQTSYKNVQHFVNSLHGRGPATIGFNPDVGLIQTLDTLSKSFGVAAAMSPDLESKIQQKLGLSDLKDFLLDKAKLEYEMEWDQERPPTPGEVWAWFTKLHESESDRAALSALSAYAFQALNAGQQEVLSRAARTPAMQMQLRRILGNDTATVRRLQNGRIAAGEMYALWLQGRITIGDKTKGAFSEILQKVRGVWGVLNDEEAGREVMEALTDALPALRQLQYMSPNQVAIPNPLKLNGLKQRMGPNMTKIVDFGRRTFVDAAETMRSYQISAVDWIVDHFSNKTGQDYRGETFPDAKIRMISRLRNEFIKPFEDKSAEFGRQVLEVAYNTKKLSQATPEVRDAYRHMQRTFKKVHEYLKNAGLDIGEIKNYFPWVFEPDYLADNKSDFVALLLQPKFRTSLKNLGAGFTWNAVLQRLARLENIKAANRGHLPAELAEEYADLSDFKDKWDSVLPKKRDDHSIIGASIKDAWATMFDDAANYNYVQVANRNMKSVEDVIERVYNNIMRNSLDDELTVEGDPTFTPAFRSGNTRVLNFVEVLGDVEDMNVLSRFFSQDLGLVLDTYINTSVKKAEYTRRFDKKGENLTQKFGEAMEEFGRRMHEQHPDWTAEQREARIQDFYETLDNYVHAMLGTHGFKTWLWLHQKFGWTGLIPDPNAPENQGKPISPKLQKVINTIMVYQNVRLLVLATISSLIDPIGIAVRTGDLKLAFDSFKAGVRSVYKEARGDHDLAVSLGKMLGIIDTNLTNEALGWEYGGVYMTGWQRKINEGFFKWTGLQFWTRSTRVMALHAGMRFLAYHKNLPKKHSERWLTELGVKPDDIVLDKNGDIKFHTVKDRETASKAEIDRDDRVKHAIFRFVDESILRPTAAYRPIWASDQHYSLFFHLKSFMYTFHDRYVRRVIHEMEEGNYMPMLALASFVPAMMAAELLRDMIQHGGTPPRKAHWGMPEYMMNGLTRSGVPGITLVGFDAANDIEYGGVGFESWAGPTVQQLLNPDLVKALPANNLWRGWLPGG